MKKKVLSVVMAAAMMTSVFSATAVTASAADAEELTIWVHETDSPEGQLYKTLIDEFNKEYEGTYHATLTQIARSGDAGGYDDKVNAAITNGGLPDVFTVDGVAVAQYADANAIVPIGDYFKEDELADFNPSIIQQGTYNDELYTLGAMDSSVGIFYNKDMFEKAGITEVPTSLEGILAIGDDLKTKGGAGEPLALSIYGWYFEQWLCKQGLSYADNGNGRDAAATAVEFDSNGGALNILNAWKALNDADVAPNVGRAGSDTATTDFTSGKAAITLGSTASLKQILQDVNGSFEVGTAYFPTIKDGDEGGVSIGGASLWALNNNDDAKAAATWKFIKFLISPESQAYWNAETGYFPVTRAADEEQTFKDNVAQYPQFQTAIDQLHDSKPQYAGALLSVFPEARQIVETEIENMINGNETPEKAVESMASQINSSIEDYNLVNE